MKHLFNIVIFVLFSQQMTSQSINKVQIEKKIDTIFKEFTRPGNPGVAITVLQHGKVITKKNFGLANLEHNIPFTHQSPTRLVYSMGREFMSVGISLMEAEGLLRFDDKVKSYFPKLPEWSKDVTIQDLLNHSSGFDDEMSLILLMQADMRNRVDKEELLTLLYNQPKPQIEPGKGYMYCNTDYALLRFIMEIAAKESLPNYLKKHLFDPLGMSSTFMNDNIDEVIPGFADSYRGNDTFKKVRSYKFSPGGNYRMVTTADDLQKWAIFADDSTSIVAKAFERLYKNARPIPVISPMRHYVFGHEWNTIDKTEYLYHGGVDENFYIFRIPTEKITIIVLGNTGNSIDGLIDLTKSLLPNRPVTKSLVPEFPKKQVTLNKTELVKYEGRYFQQGKKGYNSHVSSLQFYDIKMVGDSLRFFYNPNYSSRLTPYGKGLFKDILGNSFRFTDSASDPLMKLEAWPGDRNELLLFYRNEDMKITKEYLQQFTGQYHSSHLDYYFRIVVNEEDQLVIKRPTVSDKIMEPYGKNRFIFEMETGGYSVYETVTFSINSKGEVDGFNVQDSRLMHHRFDKVK